MEKDIDETMEREETTSVPTKKRENLNKYAINITNQSLNGEHDRVFGRETEFDDLCKILLRKRKNNAVLIGSPGVGKSVLIHLLAKRINDGKICAALSKKVIYGIDSASITAGTQYRGQMEQRLKNILSECEDDEIILFIDEIHTILSGGGSDSSSNIANIMKPYLTSGKMQVIGATTFDEYKKHFEKDAALCRRFNKITINEPSNSECVSILKNCISGYEEYHNVKFSDEILETIPVLSKKYIKDRFLPDSAFDVIDELGAKIKMERTKPNAKMLKLFDEMEEHQNKKSELIKEAKWDEIAIFKPNVYDKCKAKIDYEKAMFYNKVNNSGKVDITEKDVLAVVSKISKVPLDSISNDGKENLKKFEQLLDKNLVNQDEAKNKIMKNLKKSVLGFSNPNKPLSMLFLGQSGGGKTFLTKLLAKAWFNDSLIRIDMSEFQDKMNSSGLIGASAGYVGYEEGGVLTEKVRNNPYSVILFDEIEKADKQVLNTLLPVLDEGHLTDSKGRLVDFKNTIIIMTSNLGVRESSINSVGFNKEDNKTKINNSALVAAKKYFTPEFYNRLDEIIVFKIH